VDFSLSSEEEAFRQDVRDFLAEHLPPRHERPKGFLEETWLPKVREKRWVGFSWPREVGGGGGSVMQQAILKEEMTRTQAPPLGTSWMGLQWDRPWVDRLRDRRAAAALSPGHSRQQGNLVHGLFRTPLWK
jgi:alkylation response protein AidB-like acyl-CoA dehydrogenase